MSCTPYETVPTEVLPVMLPGEDNMGNVGLSHKQGKDIAMKPIVVLVASSLIVSVTGCTSQPESKRGTASVTAPEPQTQIKREATPVAKPEPLTQIRRETPSVSRPEPQGEIVSVARLDYDWRTGKGGGLAGLTVYLNEKGITADRQSKSGWVNLDAWGTYKDNNGLDKKVLLKKICFWVNDGGKNWLDFSVEKALLDGKDSTPITVATKLEKLSEEENRPVIILDGTYKLIPRLRSLSNMTLVQE